MGELDEVNKVTEAIIDAAIDVHRALGPGLLKSAYQACLAYELNERGRKVEQQKQIPVVYKNIHLDAGYRLDLLVDDKVIVEILSVDSVSPIHEAQLLSYMRLSEKRVGLILNFNFKVLRYGIRRLANGSN